MFVDFTCIALLDILGQGIVTSQHFAVSIYFSLVDFCSSSNMSSPFVAFMIEVDEGERRKSEEYCIRIEKYFNDNDIFTWQDLIGVPSDDNAMFISKQGGEISLGHRGFMKRVVAKANKSDAPPQNAAPPLPLIC